MDVEKKAPESKDKDIVQTLANMAITMARIGSALTAVIDQCNRNTALLNDIDKFLTNGNNNNNPTPERLDS